MTWLTFHSESERLATDAQLALSAKDRALALDLYQKAANLEQRALNAIDPLKARTRGVTAVSAVALWFKAEEYESAEKLAYSMLADSRMPGFARGELRHLVQAIWTECSKREAGVAFLPGQVMVSVKGGEVVTGGAPLDLIVDKVQTIQSMFYRTIEFLNGAAHRRHGPPSRDLQESCRPWLFQSPPGSYQFSVAIQKPAQSDFFRQDIDPARVAEHFLEIVNASAVEGTKALEGLVPDADYRRTFLKLARNLAPTGKKFDRIEFRSSGESRGIGLDPESRAVINGQLRREGKPEADQATPEELRGTLRAVDLDKDWLDVIVDGVSMHVAGLEDTVDDVIGPMVNRSVLVRVVRVSPKKLKFIDIELDE